MEEYKKLIEKIPSFINESLNNIPDGKGKEYLKSIIPNINTGQIDVIDFIEKCEIYFPNEKIGNNEKILETINKIQNLQKK